MDCGNLTQKRITIFSGHYGSGKTNIAVNCALNLAKKFGNASVVDLDIVNPYFRTEDARSVLEKANVRLIASEYANTNVDTPALPAEAYSVFEINNSPAVIDVGGDDRGALALGRYVDIIKAENNYDMLFVINKCRYFTSDAKSTVEIMREIESAANLRFTAVVNNTNLGEETTPELVKEGIGYANEVCALANLPLRATCAERKLCGLLDGKDDNLYPIDLYVRQSWLKSN